MWSCWLKLAYAHHIHVLVLKKEERWGDAEVAFLTSTVFCRQVVGLLTARETGKFSLYLHNQMHKTGAGVGYHGKEEGRIWYG